MMRLSPVLALVPGLLVLLIPLLFARTGKKGREKMGHQRVWEKLPVDKKLSYLEKLQERGDLSYSQYMKVMKMVHREESARQYTMEQRKKSLRGQRISGRTKRPTQVKDTKTSSGRTIEKIVISRTAKKPSPAPKKIRIKRAGKKPDRTIKEKDDDYDYDFEEDLRKELGLQEKTDELSFEEELRKISKIGRKRRRLRSGAIENMMMKRTEDGHEYILPPITIFEAEFKEGPNIDEIFLMNKDGMLIRHFGFSKTSGIDEDILASMLMVIQNFISDSFSEKETDLKELHLGDFNILIHQGKLYFNAVVISSDENLKSLEKSIEPMIREIEKINEGKFDDWNGDLDEFKGIKDCIAKLINNQY